MRRLTDSVCKELNSWQASEVRVDSTDLPWLQEQTFTVTLHHGKILNWLTDEFSDPDNNGYLVWRGRKVFDGVNGRCYDAPHLCNNWLKLQDKLDQHLGRQGIIAGIQLFIDKTLLTTKGLHAQPVRVALLNLAYGRRIEHIADLAFIPSLEVSAGHKQR